MRLYDTRSDGVREFIAGRTVRLYVCGITPYDATHLGHAFTYTVFDVLVRYLEHLGHRVVYARNITDVDDDILRKAHELDEPYQQIAQREMARFDYAMAALGNRPPDVAPAVSDNIEAIVCAVEGLVANGSAYALPDGRVYFDTGASERFGWFSRLDRHEMLRQFAEKGGDPEAQGKRDPLDFLLWQPSAPAEPAWDSPWGAGRPGWHIECSVMAMEHLSVAIDIHGGGDDLIFPHHEAEVCQSEHLTGQGPFARFWMHTGMVALDEEKMSKSLGNLVFAGDLLERYESGALRRYLLAHHYRDAWTFADEELDEAAASWKAWRNAADGDGRHQESEAAFHAAMADDLDTPRAIAAIDLAAEQGAGATVRELTGILGFSFSG